MVTDPDLLFPAEPRVRDIARELFAHARDLPIISPHGHVDPWLLADDRAFPDPAADLRAVTARLERAPVDLPVTDPGTGKPVRYTRHDIAAGLLTALSNLRTAVVLPRMLHSAARGDWKDVLAAAQAPSATSGPAGWQLMALTIDCYEPEERLRRAQTEAAARGSFLTAGDMQTLVNSDDVCGVMPAPSPGTIHRPPTTESVPMLFVNGNADPKDPPTNVAGASRVYPDSLTLTVPNQAHDYNLDPTCRAALFGAFIRTASTRNLPSQCLQEQSAPPFDLG